MKRIFYEIKIYFNSWVVVFFSLIFPLLLMMFINEVNKNVIINDPLIGVNEKTQTFIENGKLVQDYQTALENGEIEIYIGDKMVVLDKNKAKANVYKTIIESKIQGVDKAYSQTKNENQNSFFIPILTMQALYIIFIVVLLFNRYHIQNATGQRILVSGTSRFKQRIITAVASLMIHSGAIALMIGYLVMSQLIEVTLYNISIIILLMLIGLAIGLLVVQIPKISLDVKQGIGVWIAQLFTLIGGGFGFVALQYIVGSTPLKYFSPVLLANSLLTYQFELDKLVALILWFIGLLIIGWFVGGKNDNI